MPSSSDLPKGWRFSALPEIDSTNAEVLRQAEHGEEEGLALRADVQTAGRSRRGRVWFSPKGNLYLSILADALPATSGQVGFAAALALCEAVEAMGGHDVPNLRCKWPNDLMLDDAKVAGLLLEAVPDKDQVVIGFGVNLVPTEVDNALYPVGALTCMGDAIDLDTLATHICQALQSWLGTWRTVGFAPLRRAWLDRAHGLHQPIVVQLPTESLEGTFDGLADDGALMLDQGGRTARIIPAGDVFFAPVPGP